MSVLLPGRPGEDAATRRAVGAMMGRLSAGETTGRGRRVLSVQASAPLGPQRASVAGARTATHTSRRPGGLTGEG